MKTGSLYKTLRNNILVGLILLAPIVVTGFIVNWLFKFFTNNAIARLLTNQLFFFLPSSMQDAGYKQTLVRIVSFLLMLSVLFLIGFFVRSFLGKKLYRLGDKLIGRIPFVNRIYIYIRQISEAFLAQQQTLFKEVVLVQYPRVGLYSLGFVTATAPPEIKRQVTAAGEDTALVSLFIPTTPNPTSGLMIVAPRSDLLPLPISISDAMKLVVSAGAVFPGDGLTDDRPTLLDKLEAWMAREGKPEPLTDAGGP